MAITKFPKQEIENELMGIYPIDSRSNGSISCKRHSKDPQENGSRVRSIIQQIFSPTPWSSKILQSYLVRIAVKGPPLFGLSPQEVFMGPN